MPSKNIVDCPIRNQEYDCMQCEFYTNSKRKDGEFRCIHFATYDAMVDIVDLLRLVLQSGEGNRLLAQQSLISQMKRGPTPELKRLLGVADES